MSNYQRDVLRDQWRPIELIVSAAIIAGLVSLSAGRAIAQKRPKPAPTPVPGAQVEPANSRVTPDAATTDTGGGQVNKNNGMGTVKNESGGTGLSESPGAGRITKLRITLVTGSDDLRSNSQVRAFLITRNGKRIESRALNCKPTCQGIPDGTQRIFEWNVATEGADVTASPEQAMYHGATIYPADVYRFGLSFDSNGNWQQTGDNWNLDKLEVEYVVEVGGKASPAGTFLLYKNSGSPLYRFKTKEEWETDPLHLPN